LREHKESEANIEERNIYWTYGKFNSDYCLIDGHVVNFNNAIWNKWRCRTFNCPKSFGTKEERDEHEAQTRTRSDEIKINTYSWT
jgi:hypothetical protein